MAQYQEGQKLDGVGKDGVKRQYVVVGGMPRLVMGNNPKVQLGITHEQLSNTGEQLGNTSKTIGITKERATLPSDIARSRSEADIAASNAALLRQKVEEAAINKRLLEMGPTSQVHGDAYLKQFVPPSQWETVKAYARGDLGSKAGGMSASMLPIIQHAMNYDPGASGTNFPARAKMQMDLAGSQPGTAGGSLRAMERMLLHGQEVLHGGADLNNFGPGIVGSIGNTVRTAYDRHADDPTLNHYEELVRNYAPEAQKAIAQTSGGQGERQDRASSFDASSSQPSRAGALQADAKQALDAMGAVNSQYKRLMGHDIVDALSPEAKRAYDEIMAGGFGKDGKPLHPAQGWTPISAAPGAGGNGGDGGGGGNNTPVAPASGPTKTDPEKTAFLDHLIRAGTPWSTASRLLQQAGMDPTDKQTSYETAVNYVHDPKHPERINAPTSYADVVAPTTALNRALATPLGTAAANIVNTGMGGIPTWLGGNDARLAMDANNAANPKSALAGQVGGFIAGAAGLGKLGKAAGLLKDAAPAVDPLLEQAPGKLSRTLSYLRGASPDLALGASNGASENPDHPWLGAATGAASVVAGHGIGHTIIGPGARLLAETAPGQAVINGAGKGASAVRGMFGRDPVPQFNPPTATPGGNSILGSGATAPGNIGNIRGQLNNAVDLNMPMGLADTDPRLQALLGSSARFSPNVRALADSVLSGRAEGRNARAVNLIDQHLAPTGNVTGMVDASNKLATAVSDPHYQAAMGHPPVNDIQINNLLGTNQGQAAARQGYTNAESKGISPGELSMTIDPVTGQPRYDTSLNWPTLQKIKFGMDANLEGMRDPLTRQLDTTPGSPADGLQALRQRYTSRLGQLNGDFAQGNRAYGQAAKYGETAQQGYDLAGKAPSMNPDQVANIASAVPGQYQPIFRSGYASKLADQIRNKESDPYGLLNGPDGAQQRLASIFPDGAPKIAQANQMEDAFTATKNEALHGSPTQSRNVMDKIFKGAALAPGAAFDYLSMAHTGMPLGTMLGVGALGLAKGAANQAENKMTTSLADRVGPQLLNVGDAGVPDPSLALAHIDMLLKQQAARAAFNKQWAGAGGMFGGAVAPSLAYSAQN